MGTVHAGRKADRVWLHEWETADAAVATVGV
jgi:hypothetical protein